MVVSGSVSGKHKTTANGALLGKFDGVGEVAAKGGIETVLSTFHHPCIDITWNQQDTEQFGSFGWLQEDYPNKNNKFPASTFMF